IAGEYMAKVVVLQHIECEPLGRIETALISEGLSAEYVRIFDGQPVPTDLNGVAGLIVMGGPMSVYEQDHYPHLRQEVKLIETALASRTPLLGVCLGSQLLAAALGAKVAKGSQKEIGWHPVELTHAGQTDSLWKEVPAMFTAYHWHGDVFDLPNGAHRLAFSAPTAHQAFRYGSNAYGILFHLEVTEPIIRGMVGAFSAELRETGRTGEDVLDQAATHLPALQAIGNQVFRRWAQQATGSS
ncbi:MAG TPA: gamma-glutamyl-gamma-aminobutyrate hydrolase family protein, partial [Nitrospiraceae bacterium]|nr:gamma-glutamyl-gamma-aminobutyrate hydrolase family protein [Nitrospiraceae bacterium]